MKQCEICFDEYQENKSNQKYCGECGKDPNKFKKHYEIATYLNKKNAGEFEPVPRENHCRMCGKKWLSIYNRTFCGVECLELHRKNTGKCLECNQLLIEKGNETGRGFCSEECRKARQIKKAIADGNFIPCKICKKEFISKGYKNIFCSRDCFNINHENQRQLKVPKEKKVIKNDCEYCKKEFVLSEYRKTQRFCSKECSISNSKIKGAQYKEENKKKIKEELKIGKELNICTTCRTSQRDCERFTTNFVYVPIGAKKKEINGKFVIVSCPKFK